MLCHRINWVPVGQKNKRNTDREKNRKKEKYRVVSGSLELPREFSDPSTMRSSKNDHTTSQCGRNHRLKSGLGRKRRRSYERFPLDCEKHPQFVENVVVEVVIEGNTRGIRKKGENILEKELHALTRCARAGSKRRIEADRGGNPTDL